MNHIEFSAGRRDCIRFWYDKWCGEVALKDLFPVLFGCSTNRNASINSVVDRASSTAGVWNSSFIRDFNDWKLPLGAAFFQFLHPLLLRHDRMDSKVWKHRQSGQFDVSSFYSALQGSNRMQFPWKSIWGVKAPRCISFFIWIAARGTILTCDNLMRRGHIMAGWCCMCKHNWETGDHLLLHCETASALWSFILQAFRINWVMPAKVIDLLFGWYNWFGKHSSGVWNLVPLCLMWTLWQERNRRIFEGLEKSTSQIKEQFSGLLYDCSKSWGFTDASSLPDFVVSFTSD